MRSFLFLRERFGQIGVRRCDTHGHMLGTCVYSQRLRPKPVDEVVRRWRNLGNEALAISAIGEAEILYGLEKKQSERLWQEYREYLENALTILPLDQPVVSTFARLKVQQEDRGEPRADFDLLIAATAIQNQLILTTLTVRHFEGLPGLEVEDWS